MPIISQKLLVLKNHLILESYKVISVFIEEETEVQREDFGNATKLVNGRAWI